MLEIQNLSVSFNGKGLLSDININIETGARHLLSGHNGSGKSTLVNTIAGAPDYKIDAGKIIFDGRDITNESPTSRALFGIFLGGQNVPEIPGLTVLSFLKHSLSAHTHFNTGKELSMGQFLTRIEEIRNKLDIPRDWLNRSINVGFSGGERKKLMLLRLLLISPKFAILDEPDSGADHQVQNQIVDVMHSMTDTTFLFISHQQHFTDLVEPTHITTLSDGKVMIK